MPKRRHTDQESPILPLPPGVLASIEIVLIPDVARLVGEYASMSQREMQHKLYKSEAKREFLLTDEDLEQLQCKTRKNPYWADATPTTLYLHWDVMMLAYEKWGDKAGIDEERSIRSYLTAERNRKIIESRTQRRDRLVKALKARGLELREDSRLCENYINGNDGPSLSYVVQTMQEMKFYYEKTNYQAHHRRLKQEKPKWSVTILSDVAKRTALKEFVQSSKLKWHELRKHLPESLVERSKRLLEDHGTTACRGCATGSTRSCRSTSMSYLFGSGT